MNATKFRESWRPRRLHRLVFTSLCRIDGEGVATGVSRIVERAAERNALAGVSAALLLREGAFIGLMDGPYLSVMETYGRILNDRRHQDVHLIYAGAAETRAFEGEPMRLLTLSNAAPTLVEALDRRGLFQPRALTGETATRLLVSVGHVQTRLAETLKAA